MVWEPELHDSDAGSPDGGADQAKDQALVFVSVFLRPNACDMGESPRVDADATYAIDVVRWRIAAVKH
jgi:hypothetical protein